jgi:allantoicase
VLLKIYPCGGVSRLRVFAKPEAGKAQIRSKL